MGMESKITIKTFKAIFRAITESDNLDVMTNHLAELLVATMGIKGCALYVLDLETKELELLTSFGLSAKYLTKGPVLAYKSISANLEGKAVIVADVSKDDNIQYPEQAKQEGIAAILSIPIVFSNQILGSLRLYHQEVWQISDQDLDSLQLLAESIGLAMAYTSFLNSISWINEIIHKVVPADRLPGLKRGSY